MTCNIGLSININELANFTNLISSFKYVNNNINSTFITYVITCIIDIIYVFSTTRLIELKEDDSEISEEVKKEFYLHEPVKRVNCKTVNDRIIFLLSFAFDLYYNYSRGLILDKGYYDKIFEHIKDKEKFKPYFDEVEHYLKESEIDA